jgi:ABC-type branched-subunit amino acid transport system ATPase component
MIEHDLGLIERICDHVVVMANGTVIASGSMDELRKEEAVINAYLRG